MNERLVYHSSYFDGRQSGDDTMGFAFLIPLISAAPSIFSSIASLFGGGRKAQCQGLQEINTCGQQAVTSMQQILAGIKSGQVPPNQAVQQAQDIVSKFNDPTIVYPAKKGNDAAARTQFISQLNDLLQQVQAAAASVPAVQTDAAGNPIAPGGISTSTLLIVGGGILLLSMLNKD